MKARKPSLQNIVSGFGVRSEHHIDILNGTSIEREHLNVFLTEQFIEKTVSFWDPAEKFRRSHLKCSIKKTIVKNSTIFTGKHLCWSLFSPVLESLQFIKKRLQRWCFPVNIADILRITFVQNTFGRLLIEVECENISQW